LDIRSPESASLFLNATIPDQNLNLSVVFCDERRLRGVEVDPGRGTMR
jgi:hypothetical protein